MKASEARKIALKNQPKLLDSIYKLVNDSAEMGRCSVEIPSDCITIAAKNKLKNEKYKLEDNGKFVKISW